MNLAQSRFPLALALASVLAMIQTGCATRNEPPESQGVIAKIGDGIQALSEVDSHELCNQHFCEPNYVYHASFGSHRHQDDNPAPPPPAPAPKPHAPYPAEQLDWSRYQLRMPEAWAITEGSPSIVVAVVDSGATLQHPDLADNIWSDPGTGERGYDFVNNRRGAEDDNGHGTHCSGIIAAERNGIGIIGIAPRTRIMPVKFLNSAGSGTTDGAIAAIRYAADHGAQIISNSWGGGGKSDLLDEAIQYARSKGAIVVAAAGNESSDNDSVASYPANYSGVVAVASSNESGGLSYFSNFGRTSVLISAPGSDILSSVTGDSWALMSGTSMATPQVSGALALALSLDPGRDRGRLIQDLCDSSDPVHTDRVRCGMLDVLSLVQRVRGG